MSSLYTRFMLMSTFSNEYAKIRQYMLFKLFFSIKTNSKIVFVL